MWLEQGEQGGECEKIKSERSQRPVLWGSHGSQLYSR